MAVRLLVALGFLLMASGHSPALAQTYLGEGRTGYQLPPGQGEARQLVPPSRPTRVERPRLVARIDREFRDYMARYTRPVEQLSRACARSRFLPDRSLRIRFRDDTVSIAAPEGRGLLVGRELANPEAMYFFHYEGTTSCRVYSRAAGGLGAR